MQCDHGSRLKGVGAFGGVGGCWAGFCQYFEGFGGLKCFPNAPLQLVRNKHGAGPWIGSILYIISMTAALNPINLITLHTEMPYICNPVHSNKMHILER